MVRVLQITSHDVTIKKLLLPLIDRLTGEGYQVVSACTPGRYTPELKTEGYLIEPIHVDRRITPLTNGRTIWQMYRLMRRERFDIVHVHMPVAAALGRVAARLARTPIIIYTAHGFYFHEHMSGPTREAYTLAEKFFGRFATDMLFTQSREDAATAVRQRICPEERVTWIGNGVDVGHFNPGPPMRSPKESFGLPPSAQVVGFMGRIVAEKGVVELMKAFQQAIAVMPNLHLLVVGDNLDGERDRTTRGIIRSLVEEGGLSSRVVFAGYVDDVSSVMRAIDLFVLPSHREGMPRSIIEAMASGKPVIATNIRGCREEVVHDVTGLLVPVGDSEALSQAMVRILSDPELARQMGDAGRQRAEALFDEQDVLDRQVCIYQQLVRQRLNREEMSESSSQPSARRHKDFPPIDEPDPKGGSDGLS